MRVPSRGNIPLTQRNFSSLSKECSSKQRNLSFFEKERFLTIAKERFLLVKKPKERFLKKGKPFWLFLAFLLQKKEPFLVKKGTFPCVRFRPKGTFPFKPDPPAKIYNFQIFIIFSFEKKNNANTVQPT